MFEGDMCFTSDGVLVLEHDWAHYYTYKLGIEYEGQVPTYKEYMATTYYEQLTPMDLPSLMEFMIAREDVYFMTDFKDCLNEGRTLTGFQQIVNTAREMNCEPVLKRFIIQVYHEEFKEWVEFVYPFENFLFTYYMTPTDKLDPERIAEYCNSKNIPVITMWTYWLDDDWCDAAGKYNLNIYVHTENNVHEVNRLIAEGAAGVYTDYITEFEVIMPQIRKIGENG